MSEPWKNREEVCNFIEKLGEPRKSLIEYFIKSKIRCLKQKDILNYMTEEDRNEWGYTKLRAQKGLISKECKKIDKEYILPEGKGNGDERIHCMDEDVYKLLIDK